MSEEGRTPSNPNRRKRERRGTDRRVAESPTAKLEAAPDDHGFSIDQPYTQRRLIVVVPGEVLAVEPTALEGLKKKASATDRADALIAAVEEKSGTASGISAGVAQTIRGVMGLRDAGIEVRMVAALDAAKQLSLPPGHPFHGAVYVGHPGVPEIYYPLGDFHQQVFEHKFNEAVDLVMALGASTISVVRVEGPEPDSEKALTVAFTGDSAVNPGTGFRPKSAAKGVAQSQVLFEANFPGSDDPMMPKAMVWWKSERSWQTLARARIRHRTEDFSLTVRYENDYGVNEQLRRHVEAAGLDLGGRFHAQVDTVWKLNVGFPAASPELARGAESDAAKADAQADAAQADAAKADEVTK